MAKTKIDSFLKSLRNKTGSTSIKESRYGEVTTWISTGSLALNRILSGSIRKGIPSGRITILAGETSTGKSLLAGLIMSNAIKQGFDHIFYFDAEGGGSNEFFENIGCDTEKIEQILVSSVEEAQIKILEVYNGIRELKNSLKDSDEEPPKFLCVLDSLGALVAEKLLTDADKGKVASEMGGRSKKINSMIKAITIPALETDTAMICINHVYDDPAAMFAGKIKNQGGGKGLQYMGAINVQCTKLLEKDEEKDSEQFYSGTHLRFFTIKNRFARPSLECDVYLDFKKGFVRPFESLWDEAIRGGFILNPKQGYYTVPSWKEPEKMFRQSQICNSPEIWKSFLKEFDEWSINDLKYQKIGTDEENLETLSVEDIEIPVEINESEEVETKEEEVTEEVVETKRGRKKKGEENAN